MKKLAVLLNKIFILVFYRNDSELLSAPGKKDRDFFIVQAVFGTVVVNLLFTTFLSGIFIYYDTPDSVLSYIPILPSIAGILLIFSGMFTERIRKTKKVVIVLNIVSKIMITMVVWIPLFISNKYTPYFMLISAFVGFVLNGIMSILISNWFVEVVEEKIRGRYMSVRQVFTLIVSATIPVLAGRFLDTSQDKYMAFCIIFTVGFLFSLLESFALSRIREPIKEEHERLHVTFSSLFKIPLKNKPFMKFVGLMMFFHVFWTLSMSFASVYQLKYMGISYTYLNLMIAMSSILQLILYPIAGKLLDKHGSKKVMSIAFFFFMLHGLLYFFMIPKTAYIVFFLLNINAAFIGPAWILSSFNERFSLIPKKGRTVYDSFFTSSVGVAILLGPVIGNLLRTWLLSWDSKIIDYQEFRILFLLTFIILLFLNISLLIKNKRTKKNKIS